MKLIIELDKEVLTLIDEKAKKENRTRKNYIETLLIKEVNKNK